MNASDRGHQDIVKYLVKQGANINAQGIYLRLTKYKRRLIYYLGDRALLKASEKGHQGIVQYLVDHGADINAQGVHRRQIRQEKSLLCV